MRIGRVGRPHGVRGELVLVPDSPPCATLATGVEVVVRLPDGLTTTHRIRGVRTGAGENLVLGFVGIDDRSAASTLTGGEALVRREVLALHKEDLLVADLPGLQVVCQERRVGTVSGTYHNGVHDVMTIATGSGLVDYPVTEEHVLGLDGQGRLVIASFDGYEAMTYEDPDGGGR